MQGVMQRNFFVKCQCSKDDKWMMLHAGTEIFFLTSRFYKHVVKIYCVCIQIKTQPERGLNQEVLIMIFFFCGKTAKHLSADVSFILFVPACDIFLADVVS